MDQLTRENAGEAAARRRTFAVISHPDAGKSTLTEALALYSHAIKDAGVTHGKASRHTTVSDWMGMEQDRGISISSAALQLDYRGTVLNLVDTPGHADFSEDTYRVLSAVDCAVMLIDAAKGFEPQTKKLLAVCRQRNLPIITVINKWDRPGLGPLELIDAIASHTAMTPVPLTWPSGRAGQFDGLFDPWSGAGVRLQAVGGGALPAIEEAVAAEEASRAWPDGALEAELVAAANGALSPQAFHEARQTPVLFTAAARNFGVRQLLDVLVDLAPSPTPRPGVDGTRRSLDADLSAFVFKVQAGQDTAHRDHIAYLRVCSGVFHRGMVLTNTRTGRGFSTKYAHKVVGRDREVLEDAYPGDIVGLVNAARLRVGDTLFDATPVQFPEIPHFSPELFSVARAVDPGRYKQFRRGIDELEHEGVVQVLRSDLRGYQAPVLAAVGRLQFEVAQHRMAAEFGAPALLEDLPYTLARAVHATPDHETTMPQPTANGARKDPPMAFRGGEILHRGDGEVIAVFVDHRKIRHFQDEYPHLVLHQIGDDGSQDPGHAVFIRSGQGRS